MHLILDDLLLIYGKFKVFSVFPIDKTQVVAYNNAVND